MPKNDSNGADDLDREIVGKIKDSLLAVGQIDAIVVCQQHPSIVLSGRHRAAAGAKRKVLFDIDQFASRKGVSHEVAEQLVRVSANVQRHVSEAERRGELLELAERLQRMEVPRSQIAGKVAEFTGFSPVYVYQLIPEYKSAKRSEAIKRGLKTAANVNSVNLDASVVEHAGTDRVEEKDGKSTVNNQALGKLVEQTKGEMRAEFSKQISETLTSFEASLLKKLKDTFQPPVQVVAPVEPTQPGANGGAQPAPAAQAAPPVITPTSHMEITLKVPVSTQLVSLFEDWKAAANHRARMEGKEEYTVGMEQFMVDCTMQYFEDNGVDYVLNLGNPLGRFIRR